MDRVISYVLGRIEDELAAQNISKRDFAERLGMTEHTLHSRFAIGKDYYRELSAEEFIQMLYALRISCDCVLPPKMALEVRGLTLEEYISRLVGLKLQELLKTNGFSQPNGGEHGHEKVP